MLFYGTITQGSSMPPMGMGMGLDMTSTPMMNQPAYGEMLWAVENIYKAETTAIDTPKDYWYTGGDGGMTCLKVFMSFFFIPFFHIPMAFLIIPWVV